MEQQVSVCRLNTTKASRRAACTANPPPVSRSLGIGGCRFALTQNQIPLRTFCHHVHPSCRRRPVSMPCTCVIAEKSMNFGLRQSDKIQNDSFLLERRCERPKGARQPSGRGSFLDSRTCKALRTIKKGLPRTQPPQNTHAKKQPPPQGAGASFLSRIFGSARVCYAAAAFFSPSTSSPPVGRIGPES